MEFIKPMEQKNGGKLARAFLYSLIVLFVGMGVGTHLPINGFLLFVVQISLIFGLAVVKKKKSMSFSFLFIFMFLEGIGLTPVLNSYVSSMGTTMVLEAFAVSVVSFSGIAIYASLTKKDFRPLGAYLFSALLALIIILLFGMFFPMSGAVQITVSYIGVLIFLGYTLYDFNKIRKEGIKEEDIPLLVINLYLDFINIFTYMLRIFKR